MIKVKEWLDKNMFILHQEDSSVQLKENGHYCIHGYWSYPENIFTDELLEDERDCIPIQYKRKLNFISVNCNNETLLCERIVIDGKYVGLYGYLQTYEHILRGEPDKNGYYARSTDEEIIKHLDNYLQQIILKEKCYEI